MKNKHSNKTLIGKSAKDILSLVEQKQKESVNEIVLSPQNDIEQSLFAFFSQLLGNNSFGVKEDFFKLGGNSLKGIQLVSKISKSLDVQIELTDIFLHPTIEELAIFINEKLKVNNFSNSLEKQIRPEYIPLSYAQERLWFIDNLDGSAQYHIPSVIRIKGELNIEYLETSIQEIVKRHQILRPSFKKRTNRPISIFKHLKIGILK